MKYSKTVPNIANLDELLVQLYKAFESDDVDTDYVKELLNSYKSNPNDWKKFVYFDPNK